MTSALTATCVDLGERMQIVVTDHGSTQPTSRALTGLAKADADRQAFDGRVLDSRSFAPFRFRHDLARRPPKP